MVNYNLANQPNVDQKSWLIWQGNVAFSHYILFLQFPVLSGWQWQPLWPWPLKLFASKLDAEFGRSSEMFSFRRRWFQWRVIWGELTDCSLSLPLLADLMLVLGHPSKQQRVNCCTGIYLEQSTAANASFLSADNCHQLTLRLLWDHAEKSYHLI